jgi:hypothetical protein
VVLLMLLPLVARTDSAAAARGALEQNQFLQVALSPHAEAPCAGHGITCCTTGQCHGIAGMVVPISVGTPRIVVEATRYAGAHVQRCDGCLNRPVPPPPRA